MIRQSITPQEVVDFLNMLAQTDPSAVQALVNLRVLCNDKMANHPTVQVASSGYVIYPGKMGILGVINGLFGVFDDGPKKGYGPILVEMDEHFTISNPPKFKLVENR